MIAAIYARKSNEQTVVAEEARSVERQVTRCRECAARHGWTVADDQIYIDDGISGADFTARPAFLRLMNAVKPRPRFDVLIMTELSRLGREQIQTSGALLEITSAGAKVWFAHDDRECPLDSAMDKAILTFQTFGAELEREKASVRTYDAMRRKAELGHVTGGRTFGYRNVDVLGDADVHGRRKRLYVVREIDEAQASVVRRIFEMYAAGRGLVTIAKTLNAEGALCPQPFRGQPAGWAPSSVREVLYREDYHGRRRWGASKKRYRAGKKQQNDCPESDWLWVDMPQWRIVSEDLWQRVHDRLAHVRSYALRLSKGRLAAGPPPVDVTTGRRPSDGIPHLLTGVARCVCGSGLEAFRRPWQDASFYYCAANRRKGRIICAHDIKLPMTTADADVLAATDYCVFRRDVIKAVIERTVDRIEKDRSGDQAARLERERDEVMTKLARLASAIAAGGDIPALAAEARKLEERRKALEADLTGLRARGQALDPLQVRRWIEERAKDWRGLLLRNREQGRQVLQRVLTDKLTFALQTDGSCTFTGPATLGRILSGSIGKAGDTRGWWTRRESNP